MIKMLEFTARGYSDGRRNRCFKRESDSWKICISVVTSLGDRGKPLYSESVSFRIPVPGGNMREGLGLYDLLMAFQKNWLVTV